MSDKIANLGKLHNLLKSHGSNSLLTIRINLRFWKLFTDSFSDNSTDLSIIGFISMGGHFSSSAASHLFCSFYIAQCMEASLYNLGLEI